MLGRAEAVPRARARAFALALAMALVWAMALVLARAEAVLAVWEIPATMGLVFHLLK